MVRSADEVVAIRFDYRRHVLTLACPGCGTHHDVCLPTVMMVVEPICPACGRGGRLEPDTIAAACARLIPPPPRAARAEADGTVNDLVNGWSALPELAPLLDYDGHDLGAAMAHRIVPLVLRGVLEGERGRA
jgi:hypothetical protein